ncbi:MAG: hypothetical protein NNA23_10285 [Nitrospira sp.]|nr:hypothetical protein [Nitrospira sp.]
MFDVEFPDIAIHLVAVLALLVVWQFYRMQVLAGRIMAIDILDRSGIRMYIYAVPDDDDVCEVCSAANRRAFLPSYIVKKGFALLPERCRRQVPCPVVLIGLYGAWPEAREIVQRLRANPSKGWVQLSPEELRMLVDGPWEQSISADTDRVGVRMLEAVCYEKINPAVSIAAYRYVTEEAKDIRHLCLVVPAYLRLAQLLTRSKESNHVLEVIERFELRFPESRQGLYFPTREQRHLMKMRKALLLKNQRVDAAA